MSSDHDSPQKFHGWLLAAIGTIAIGLGGAWVKFYLGPEAMVKDELVHDECVAYNPDKEYINELMDQAQRDTNSPNYVHDIVYDSVRSGHYMAWVLRCGKPNQAYEREINGSLIRVIPYEIFTDHKGTECREIGSKMKIDGRWQGSQSLVFCKIEGKWVPRGS